MSKKKDTASDTIDKGVIADLQALAAAVWGGDADSHELRLAKLERGYYEGRRREARMGRASGRGCSIEEAIIELRRDLIGRAQHEKVNAMFRAGVAETQAAREKSHAEAIQAAIDRLEVKQ